jgi:hypothetical protein
MAQMISTMNGTPKTHDEGILKGLRRSRFSFHFNTPRVRRWLLVQWVSMPVHSTQDGEVSADRHDLSRKARPTLGRLLDDYRTHTTLARLY